VPPVLVDWLPWHHAAGGSHNIGIVIYNGGTLYIDEGRPMPGLIDRTERNLREIAPTIYFNVPRGYEALLPFLRADEALRRTFFGRMGLMQYAAAVLPQAVWKSYDALAARSTGSSNRIARALLLPGPLSIDTGEITDKGSVNQRAVLKCRADLVERLYTEPYAPQVLEART